MPATQERLFGAGHAFDQPATLALTVGVAVVLALAPVIFTLLARFDWIDKKTRVELMQRYWSWLIITPLILMPILLGAAFTILGVGALSLLCYREYARATGLFREKAISLVVVLGILAMTFAELDNWFGLFVALVPCTVGTIAVTAILRDEPKGYIQRVALGVLGFTLLGSCLGHLGLLANDANYRPVLIMVVVCVEMNDVFAFIVGRTLGKRQLAPNTSPRKTVAGAVGALALTTLLTMGIGPFVFAGTVLADPLHLAGMGLLISIMGQCGDLMLSSIKRDLGISDMSVVLPGHGGLLDRFDSMILAAPVMYYYISHFVGVGSGEEQRIWSGG